MKCLTIFVLVLLVSTPLINGKLTGDAKQSILAVSERFKDNSTRMHRFLSAVNERAVSDVNFDVSEDPDVRQILIENAAFAGVDINAYPNITRVAASNKSLIPLILLGIVVLLIAGFYFWRKSKRRLMPLEKEGGWR